MDKDEYFSISNKKNLPNRCPIVGICERWAYTIFLFGELYESAGQKLPIEVLREKGLVNSDFEQNMIGILDESPSFHNSDILVYYHNICPEVPLFNSEFRLGFIPKIATTDGEWDDLRNDFKFQNSGCKHYSECLEFSRMHYEKNRGHSAKKTIRYRPTISKTLRFEIFQRDNFTCQYCKRTKEDGIKLVIDHRIPVSQGGKTTFENLITACEDCNFGKSNKII